MMIIMCSVEKMLLIFITIAILSVDKVVEGKVTCYVCSYSGQDSVNGTIINDTCTPTHFRPELTKTVECDGGCETLAYRNSKKDKIRHFHRNCVDANSGRFLSDRCVDTKSIMYEEKCECLKSFCNSSPPSSSSPSYLGILSSMLTIMMILSQVSFSSQQEQQLPH